MTIKKTLLGLALGALLTFNVGCGSYVPKNSPQQYPTNASEKTVDTSKKSTISKYPTKTIEGKIVDIDEDSVGSYFVDMSGGFGADFQYEILRVEDSRGNVVKLLVPQPTTYMVGDEVKLKYTERKEITFKEMVGKYFLNHFDKFEFNAQKGAIHVDGIVDIGN